MTHPSDIVLLRYADGEHSKETAEHLEECTECRSVVQDSRQVSAALRALPVPLPPSAPWLGKVTFARQTRWHAIAATLVAGILIGGTATYVGESDVAFAGLVPAAERPVLPSAPHPLGPGRWTYLTRAYEDSVLWASPHLETVTVDASPAEWIIVTTTPEGERDSLLVDRGDLSPRSSSWRSPNGGVHDTQRYTRDSLITFISGYSRSRRVAHPIGDSTQIRIAGDAELRLFLRTMPLDRHWRRSVRLLPEWGLDSAQTGDLAVTGRHTIETPVGRCDCWRVTFTVRGRQKVIWVRTEDGVAVKTESAWGVTELVAEDPLPN